MDPERDRGPESKPERGADESVNACSETAQGDGVGIVAQHADATTAQREAANHGKQRDGASLAARSAQRPSVLLCRGGVWTGA